MKLQHETGAVAPGPGVTTGMGALKFALDGVMVVSSTDGHWVIPPTRALWLAPSVKHSVRTLGGVRADMIALPTVAQSALPLHSCALALTPLLRELLHVLSEQPGHDPDDYRLRLLTELLLEQLDRPCAQPLLLPTPREPRLELICNHIQDNLEDNKSLLEWSRELGLHCRTLHRLFIQEVGMSFVQWRQQAKLLAALERLADGRSILSVALDLGYQTQSAFTVMFRRSLGITPGEFIRSLALDNVSPGPGA